MTSAADDAVFAASATQRLAVVELLEQLDDDQLAAPSLCAGWTVLDVAAHLVVATSGSVVPFLKVMPRAGFRMHRANTLAARDLAARGREVVASRLRAQAGSRFTPPVVGPRGPLADVLVHEGDMRLPLGLPHDPPLDAMAHALEFVTAGRPVGFVPKGRLTGLALVAEDVGRTFGEGRPVTGRGIDLLMAACGRTAVLERLSGADELVRRIR